PLSRPPPDLDLASRRRVQPPHRQGTEPGRNSARVIIGNIVCQEHAIAIKRNARVGVAFVGALLQIAMMMPRLTAVGRYGCRQRCPLAPMSRTGCERIIPYEEQVAGGRN